MTLRRRKPYHRTTLGSKPKGNEYWGLTEAELLNAYETWWSGLRTANQLARYLQRGHKRPRSRMDAGALMVEWKGMGLPILRTIGERVRGKEVRRMRQELCEKWDLRMGDMVWAALRLCELEEIDLRKFGESILPVSTHRLRRRLEHLFGPSKGRTDKLPE